MSEAKRTRVVVAGGGTAGWMAAAAIAKTLGEVVDLTLVESDEIGTVGVGEATIPTLLTYNRLLGIDEAEFMRATSATFKLGIAFEGWRDVVHRYIHSFGVTGKDHWTAGFQHFWARGREEGVAKAFGDYCLELVAAEEGRFAHLPKLGLNYAYHIDSAAFARFLRGMAEAHGARRVEGKIRSVERDEATGDLAALTLEDGARLEGELFLDCTGFRALLIGDALGEAFEDWTHLLPCDRAIAVQTESVRPPVPYTRAIGHEAGWRWQIPLQHRTGNGTVFCSRYLSEDEAHANLLRDIEGEALSEPRVIRFRTGTRRRHWVRNCVAIGLSSSFIEPLESTSIHLIQRNILRLLQTFPQGGAQGACSAADRDEFNRQSADEMAHIRDFIVLHYHLTDRRDTRFWRDLAQMDVPDTLTHRLRLFEETGRVFRSGDELFAENSWTQVMLGQGLTPRSHHPIVDKMPLEELRAFLDHVEQNVRRTVRTLPPHASYLARYCRADMAA